MLVNPKTNRPFGDHGTALDAIDFALDVNPCGLLDAGLFLRCWREGDLGAWPEYYAWLALREKGFK